MNTLGNYIRLTSYGESHGEAVGAVLDGLKPGIKVDEDFIRLQMQRRKPGQSKLSTSRREDDEVRINSGVFEGVTTGAPIHLHILNKDQRPQDYNDLERVYRPSHADFTYAQKYGQRDHRGGGRSSARVTAGWVAGGALVQAYLESEHQIKIGAFVKQIGKIRTEQTGFFDRAIVDQSVVRCPDAQKAAEMEAQIMRVKSEGDSLGGVVECIVQGVPVGLGEPVFAKINAQLAQAMFSINAVKGVEFGGGFEMTSMLGSEANDLFVNDQDKIITETNFSGGIQGGITNGMDIVFRVAFKPTATIAKSQKTVNDSGESVDLAASGRHDPCVVPRAIPIVETMTALVLADLIERM